MKNFKEIAEKCLAGELSGVFIFNVGAKLHSQYLKKSGSANYFYLREFFIDKKGQVVTTGIEGKEIIDFIPDNMQEQITIDIPEGKVPIMEQTEKGVVITWKEKELTCSEIYIDLFHKDQHISAPRYCNVNCNSRQFNKKVEVLRKLTNIRNYFGGDKPTNSWVITIDSARRPYVIKNPKLYRETCFIYFDTKEHAQAAVDILGDELKYLFEPW